MGNSERLERMIERLEVVKLRVEGGMSGTETADFAEILEQIGFTVDQIFTETSPEDIREDLTEQMRELYPDVLL